MILMLRILLAVLVPTVIGWVLIRFLFKEKRPDTLTSLAIAYGSGTGILALKIWQD